MESSRESERDRDRDRESVREKKDQYDLMHTYFSRTTF